ncbi:MAG: peptidoglycan editing factor PgeF [Candidatus Omnitrophota bacterium]
MVKIDRIFISRGKEVVIGISSGRRNFDLRAGNFKQEIIAARQEFFHQLGMEINDSVFLEQVHGARVFQVSKKHRGRGSFNYQHSIKGSDAAVTDEANLGLCILTADCLNIFFYQRRSQAIGISHAGWRSTQKQIAVKTAEKLINVYKGAIVDLEVYIGPGIRRCCYEVSRSFKKIFPESTVSRRGKVYLDLAGENILQLKRIGVLAKNIKVISQCTSCLHRKYFSYRQGDIKERMIGVIVKRDKNKK